MDPSGFLTNNASSQGNNQINLQTVMKQRNGLSTLRLSELEEPTYRTIMGAASEQQATAH